MQDVIKCNALISLYQGEVDILEGVNDQGTDSVTLHTSAGTRTLSDSKPEFPVLKFTSRMHDAGYSDRNGVCSPSFLRCYKLRLI